MSAEQSRLRSAIQRIAKEDLELRGAIDAAKSRGEQPGGLGVGESDGERDRICCDGSTSDNANPGSDTRDPSESAKDGLDPDDPADISDNLTGVVDCETGQPICFEGGDWIPPEGWESAQSPPIDPTYQQGYYWSARGGLAPMLTLEESYHTTCGEAQSVAAGKACGIAPGDPGCGPEADGYAVTGFWGTCSDQENDDQHAYRYQRLACDSSVSKDLCPDSPPKSSAWPSDDCINLALINGSIVGSKYDPENDGSYSSPRKEIELCDLGGGSRTLVRVDTDSTWKSIKSLDGDIDPDAGYGYLYDTASGKKIRQISPSEFRDNTV